MTQSQVQVLIAEIIHRIVREKGMTPPAMCSDTMLLQDSLPIDSLELARLVTELEERTGIDPFADGFVDFRTVGELAALYQQT